MAGGASLMLLAAGAWLHERRVRNEAALAAAAAGIAGLFATAVVAGPVYDLVPALAALASPWRPAPWRPRSRCASRRAGSAGSGSSARWRRPGSSAPPAPARASC